MLPEAGVTDSQLPPDVVLAEIVQFKTPPPEFDTATVWFAGLVPTVGLKLRLVGLKPMTGGAVTVYENGAEYKGVGPPTGVDTVIETVPAVARSVLGMKATSVLGQLTGLVSRGEPFQ